MKKILRYMLPYFMLMGIVACKKTDTVPASNIVYEETITDIKKNEPVLLTFNNSSNSTKVNWTVSPSTNTSISTVGNSATITFGVAGTYKVNATAGAASAVYTVIVTNIEYNDYGTDFNLSASKQVNIEVGESILFSVHNAAASGGHTIWSVTGSWSSYTKDTVNNTLALTFTSNGFITVTATDGTNTQSRTVWVNDPANSNSEMDTVPFILGEKLKLTPAIITISGSKQLVMQASTTNTYHCPTDKILSFSSANDYTIDYLGVAISSQACSPVTVATCSDSFSGMPVGTHAFTINFGNKTFKGSVNVSSNGIYTFTWPDESIVRISPLMVQ